MRGVAVFASLLVLLPSAVPAQDSGVGAEVLELAVAPFEAGGPASAEAPAIAQALEFSPQEVADIRQRQHGLLRRALRRFV